MAKASASRTIKLIDRGATFTCYLYSPTGDLFQEYDSHGNYYPDFRKRKPTLYLVITSSRQKSGVVIPQDPRSVTFYFNGKKILFDGDDVSTGLDGSGGSQDSTFKGVFRRVTTTGDRGDRYVGLRFEENIAGKSGHAGVSITAEAQVVVGTHGDTVQATYTLPVNPYTGSSYRVVIAPGDIGNYLISGSGESCRLRAVVYSSGEPANQGVSDPFRYEWYRLGADGFTAWKKGSNAVTGRDVEVLASEVDTQGTFMVKVYRGSDYVGSDTETVLDVSDPYEIIPGADREEVIDLSDATKQRLTYTPKLVRRGTIDGVGGTKFRFCLMDGAGVVLNTSASGTPYTEVQPSFTVTAAHAQQAGGDLILNITAE